MIHALDHDWQDAAADFRRSIEFSTGDKPYPQIYAWLSRAHLGETAAADKKMAAYFEQRPKTVTNKWVGEVAAYLLGSRTEADLLAAAVSSDATKDKEQHCDAWFYIGTKKMLAGNRTAAAEDFQRCRATALKTFVEYEIAGSELKGLMPVR